MVFVAQNAHAFIMSVSNCKTDIALHWLILGQLIIFVPLAMIRKIQKLSVFALIADVFILLGLSYLYYYDALTLVTKGVGNVEWIINPKSFPLFVGTAVFTFEGIGLGKKKKKSLHVKSVFENLILTSPNDCYSHTYC
jgi:proton-coupled amino acid transporter